MRQPKTVGRAFGEKWMLMAALCCGGAAEEVRSEEALSGLPATPFVFSGGVSHITDPDFVSDQDFQVGETAILNVHEGVHGVLSGALTNAAGSMNGLIKLGEGALKLSGSNAYKGTTQLFQGELQVGGALATGTGTLQADLGTTLSYADGVHMTSSVQFLDADPTTVMPSAWVPVAGAVGSADAVTWSVSVGQAEQAGLMSGAVDVIKQGDGRLNLTGDALGLTGAVTVSQGTLAVNTLTLASVQVEDGARLEGAGTIAALTVQRGGVLAPGNSPGTLTVSGDMQFDDGSVFEVQAQPDGVADKLKVSGQAMLDGRVDVQALDGDWQPTTSYVIVQADGGLANTKFDGVSSNLAFLTPSLAYSANTVSLTLTRNSVGLDDVAQTPDEEDVADAIDDETPDGDPAIPELHDPIVGMDADTARSAYRQLSGSWAASMWSGLVEDSRFVRQAALEALDEDEEVKGWARIFYVDRTRNAQGGVPGDDRQIEGLVAGANVAVSPALTVGGVLAAQESRMTRKGNEGAADGSVSSMYAGVVAAWRLSSRRGRRARGDDVPQSGVANGRGVLRFGLLHGWHNLAATRAVRAGGLRSNVSARYGARSVQAFSEFSWRWAWRSVQRFKGMLFPSEYAVEPYLRLSHVSLHTNAFTENGGAAALSVQGSRQDATFARLGVRAQSRFETATGRARASLDVSWRHAFGALQTRAFQSFRDSAVPTVFGSSGQPVLANAFQIALNVTGRLTRRARLSFGYAALFGPGTQDHGIQAALQVAF